MWFWRWHKKTEEKRSKQEKNRGFAMRMTMNVFAKTCI